MTESVFAYSKKIDSPESFVVVVVVVVVVFVTRNVSTVIFI